MLQLRLSVREISAFLAAILNLGKCTMMPPRGYHADPDSTWLLLDYESISRFQQRYLVEFDIMPSPHINSFTVLHNPNRTAAICLPSWLQGNCQWPFKTTGILIGLVNPKCIAIATFPNRSANRNSSLILHLLTLNVRGPSYLGLTSSIPWLLMPWLLTSPGHHPWYWLCRIGRFLSHLRKDFNYLRRINVEKWHKM